MGNCDWCKFLDWDSSFFGKRIARAAIGRLDAELWKVTEEWCKTNRIDCLYFLGELEPETMRVVSQLRFQLVDVRSTLERQLFKTDSKAKPPAEIRPFAPSDLPALRDMAGRLHRDSRFFADCRFPETRSRALFETWIEKDSKEGIVFVAHAEGETVGYVSCRLGDGQRAQIGLLGVKESAQGRGLGQGLLQTTVEWCADQSVTCMTVVTQGKNIAAQRLYQNSGFRTRSLHLWYHVWFDS